MRGDRRMIAVNGKRQTQREWALDLGASESTIYQRKKRGWSDAEIINTPLRKLSTQPIDERLWGKVIKTESCWLWQGRLNHGYGRIYNLGKEHAVHRIAFEMLRGPIPADKCIDHLCRVRHCVNPDHMEIVTVGENTLRGRTITAANLLKIACPKGHPYDKENTRIDRKGKRSCRACARLGWHKRKGLHEANL